MKWIKRIAAEFGVVAVLCLAGGLLVFKFHPAAPSRLFTYIPKTGDTPILTTAQAAALTQKSAFFIFISRLSALKFKTAHGSNTPSVFIDIRRPFEPQILPHQAAMSESGGIIIIGRPEEWLIMTNFSKKLTDLGIRHSLYKLPEARE